MIRYFIFITSVLLLASCSLMQKPLYNYAQYEDAVYRYITVQDEKSEERLIKNYEKILEKLGSRKTPPPGVCADYGYLLLKKGETTKGKALLEREKKLYPESAGFINAILKRIEK